PGVVTAAEGNWLIVMAASNGVSLFRFPVADGNSFFSGAAIANGQLYIGNNDGIFFAFKL
ncbi:MAG TPA: PQQ-binding-like beta-propeller repeat protein, partial [Hyphomicrobiaceae bacterium]|nr:PQQ-binding-like beta-propeller repeat protein [Hyphomicrobiaceae bacterium]